MIETRSNIEKRKVLHWQLTIKVKAILFYEQKNSAAPEITREQLIRLLAKIWLGKRNAFAGLVRNC